MAARRSYSHPKQFSTNIEQNPCKGKAITEAQDNWWNGEPWWANECKAFYSGFGWKIQIGRVF